MKAGLDALYTQKDPNTAAALFRKVLERNPTHYGATYQLAAALDRAGKPDEARPLWEKVLAMTEGSSDKQTADTARARLGKDEGVNDEAPNTARRDGVDTQTARHTPLLRFGT